MVEDFVKFFEAQFGTRIIYLEEVVTGPGSGGPGGRNDVLFAVHDEDVMKFAVPRLTMGIRWIEDALNGDSSIYPERLSGYRCW